MRILHLHDEPWDSGLAHYALTLAAELSRRGHAVEFWAKAGSVAAAQARRTGLPVRELRSPWASVLALRALLRRFGPDVVDAHTGSSHALGAALCAGTPTPLARTCADARPARAHWLSQRLARRTAAYVAANTAIAAHLRRAFLGARVEVIAPGVEAPAGSPAPLPPAPVVGLLGRFDPVKGHATLIEAAAILQRRGTGIELSLAGSGRFESLEASARAGLAPGTARFLGPVEGVAGFLASCRVGCAPSTGSEAVSRAALEWMAMGRPVVASAVGGLPDLIEHGVTGLLVKPGDPSALAEALERLLRDGELAERLGAASRRRYEERFSPAPFAQASLSLFASLANASAEARAPIAS